MSACWRGVRPCQACPWVQGRKAADIPAYEHERAEALASTSPDERGFGPDFGSPIFACHESREGEEFVCSGWLASVGAAHPNVRLAISAGALDPARLDPGEGWPPLHRTFAEMIANLRATRSGL